jgi:tRNA A-37 threonylcarbamoyl transferase component Bud32
LPAAAAAAAGQPQGTIEENRRPVLEISPQYQTNPNLSLSNNGSSSNGSSIVSTVQDEEGVSYKIGDWDSYKNVAFADKRPWNLITGLSNLWKRCTRRKNLATPAVCLGAGIQGKVYKVFRGDEVFAVKVMTMGSSDFTLIHLLENASREALMLQQLSAIPGHPTPEFYAAGFHRPSLTFYIVMEYIPGKTLWDYVHDTLLFDEEISNIDEQLAGILKFLHNNGIAHRDFHLQNLFMELDEDKKSVRVRVLDLGYALPVDEDGIQRNKNYRKINIQSIKNIQALKRTIGGNRRVTRNKSKQTKRLSLRVKQRLKSSKK